jgi:hypothetical protein
MAQNKLLTGHNIVFSNGLNEDLAATAVWGTQMRTRWAKQNSTVLGTWYAKARRRSQRRRAEAWQLHGHPEERRRARDRRGPTKSSSLAVNPNRASSLGHSDDLSRQPAGDPRFRLLTCCRAYRAVDRAQDRDQRRRWHRQRQ